MEQYNDYEFEIEPNQGTMFPILPVRCHCGKRIGADQRKIESLIGDNLKVLENTNMSIIDKYASARIDAFQTMGYTRTCCLNSVTMYPFLTFNDVEGMECFIDCIKHDDNNLENNFLPTNSKLVPFEILPKKKTDIGFDMDNYCQKLHLISSNQPLYKEQKINGKKVEEKMYPIFPKFNPKRRHYPATTGI